MEAAPSQPRLLTAEEVADMIGMTADYVYALSRRGAIPTITFGRTRRYRRKAIEEWLSELERGKSGPGRPAGGHGAATRGGLAPRRSP
jgi:excisionase family DNA binding protein